MRAIKPIKRVTTRTLLLFGMSIPFTATALDLGVTHAPTGDDSGYVYSLTLDYESDSETSIVAHVPTATDVVGHSVSATVRYAQFVWADNSFGTTNHAPTSAYNVTIDITSPNPSTVYDLQIATTRIGAITLADDSSFYATVYASAQIGELEAHVNGVISPALSLTSLFTNDAPLNLVVDQASGTTITGLSGDYQLIMHFEWDSAVWSNNDEAAVRLGLESTTQFVDADNYPGLGSRTLALDGHFVTVTAEVVSDGDSDGDGVPDLTDNCLSVPNTLQKNTDGAADGGDACDPNDDNDGYEDAYDNCTKVPNNDQLDGNSDDVGNACDPDSDGIPDHIDNCPLIANNDQTDTDNDGHGDVCQGLPPGC
ncbi:MAG: thrombospondin type 3 repeat-containing protein [Halioglobus sp.]|nr:thrombospondin type 3 repeat-containing protein [Halioglobus sp.]